MVCGTPRVSPFPGIVELNCWDPPGLVLRLRASSAIKFGG